MDADEHIQDNLFYHVYNRGNDRDRIFGDDSDYLSFVEKMKPLASNYMVDVPVYALMPNRFHLIAMQTHKGSLSRMMGALATSAAKRYNLKYGHIGHLFQGPYRHRFVSEEVLWYVACYIHLNPVRAGLVKDPKEWRFSNFATYEVQGDSRLLPGLWRGYAAYVREVLEDERAQKEWEKRLLEEGYLLTKNGLRRRLPSAMYLLSPTRDRETETSPTRGRIRSPAARENSVRPAALPVPEVWGYTSL